MSRATAAYDRLLDVLRTHGSRVRANGVSATAQCPAHEDRNPSLSLRRIESQALVYCHAGCEVSDVLAALGLAMRDLYDEPSGVRYDYTDHQGTVLRSVHRSPDKRFRQSGQTQGAAPLYRLPAVVEAVAAGQTVYVVEGEKDVHAIESLGAVSTCSPQGAANAGHTDWTPLAGGHVVIVPDRDQPGETYARDVLGLLDGQAASTTLALAKAGKDAADHIAAGHGLDDLVPSGLPDEADQQAAAMDAVATFARHVERQAYDLRVRDAAKAQVAADRIGSVELPPVVPLPDFLAVTDEDTRYRVAPLWPTGGRVVLSAQHKAGKTTLAGNLVRSLVDEQPFLDAFEVTPAARVVIVDDELDERMLRRWLRDQGIANTGRVTVIPLRGRLSTFSILDPATRTRWAEHIGAADVLILDCLRPALDALGLSEDKDAGRFLEALDELTTEAGIAETLVVHHMGHQGERSRGDSRILDWPDASWRLLRDADDEDDSAGTARRYLACVGRDVDLGETLLAFDPATRHLTVAGGSRRDRKVDEARDAVLDTMRDYGEPLSGRAIEERLKDTGPGRATIRAALKRAISDGDILVSEGLRNAKLHTLNPLSAPVRRSAPPVRQRTEIECASAPSRGARSLTAAGDLAEAAEPAHSTPADTCPGCTGHLRDRPPPDCESPSLHEEGVLS